MIAPLPLARFFTQLWMDESIDCQIRFVEQMCMTEQVLIEKDQAIIYGN